jgi:hypothetical protein
MINLFKIDKGIPIPPKGCRGGVRHKKYPLSEMEVGDSFYCHPKENSRFAARKLRSSIGVCGRAVKNMKFTTRILIIEELFTIRCWRIK